MSDGIDSATAFDEFQIVNATHNKICKHSTENDDKFTVPKVSTTS